MCEAKIVINETTFNCAIDGPHNGRPHMTQFGVSKVVNDGFEWEAKKSNLKIIMNKSVAACIFGLIEPFEKEARKPIKDIPF